MRFKKIPPELLKKVFKWKKIIENLKNFSGSSPPSIFVSSVSYPRTNIGILAPPYEDEKSYLLDFPEEWYKKRLSLEEIISLRSQLIYSKTRASIRECSKIIDSLQELAMSKKPILIDVELKKKPKFKFAFDIFHKPIGNPAPLSKIEIAENVKVERFVDYIISDTDLKARDATLILYQKNLPISRIQKIFSAGLLGLKSERKLVPTRWSITAVDSIVSEELIKKIRNYEKIDEILLFQNSYLGNDFFILMFPFPWAFEVIELAVNNKNQIKWFCKDYEAFLLRKEYAENVAGGYYATRLGVAEYLEKIKKCAGVFVLRIIHKEISLPLGVWKVRETVRDAFNKKPIKFETLENAIKRISELSRIDETFILNQSKILRIARIQKFLR